MTTKALVTWLREVWLVDYSINWCARRKYLITSTYIYIFLDLKFYLNKPGWACPKTLYTVKTDSTSLDHKVAKTKKQKTKANKKTELDEYLK